MVPVPGVKCPELLQILKDVYKRQPDVLAAPVSPGPAAQAVTGAIADSTAAKPAAAALRRTNAPPQKTVLQRILCLI